MIKAQKAEYSQYAGIMTQYERLGAEQEIQKTVNTWKPQIIKNLLQEQDQAITRYKAAEQGISKANAAEINRWDMYKLGPEMAVAKLLAEQALSAPENSDVFRGSTLSKQERMKQLYQDAITSGDMVKQRAVFEIIQAVPSGGDRDLNHIKKQAERDLAALRRTEDQQKAEEALEASWNDVVTHTAVLEEVAPLIGEPIGVFGAGPINQALKRVTVDRAGQKHIYNADAEEIQPVVVVNSSEKDLAHFAEG